MSIKVIDRGFSALVKRVKEPARYVTVGIHEDDGAKQHGDDSLTIAEIGAFHEYGLGNNPRRSFIADWVEENRSAHRQFINLMMTRFIDGSIPTIDQTSEQIGARFQGEVQRRIAQTPGDWPELHPETVKRKGSSKPLIDSGALRGAVTYDVHRNRNES